MGNQESSCCGCCRRIRAQFYRLEGEVLASDPPDFESARYWLAHPLHHPRRVDECLPKIAYLIQADGSMQQEDLKESDPQTLEAPADLFYLHGTMEGFGNRASINRYDQEAWIGFNTRHQMTACTAFTSACRAFAPLYRQAGMVGSWDLAFQDILSAFEHFLSESGDRPILLAGHSQGSIHIQRLVSERIAPDAAVMKRLVAVHAPGMGNWIDPSPLPLDTAAASTASTLEPSVAIWAAATPQADRKWTLIGFMSGGKGFVDFANPSGWSPGACGALLPEDDSKLPVLFRNFVESAEVADGLLRVRHHPAMEDKMQKLHSGHQDLHPYDIHLFWADVRERVKQQVTSFLSRSK